LVLRGLRDFGGASRARMAQRASDRFSTSRYGWTAGDLHHGNGSSGR
jgi:hypothetical protein